MTSEMAKQTVTDCDAPHQPRTAWATATQSKPSEIKKIPMSEKTRDDFIECVSVTSVRHGVDTWNEDQPGCSSWISEIPPPQIQITDTTADDPEEPSKKDDPLETAWTDMVDRVSVAGWQEVFNEKILWIRACYRVILVTLSIICVYYISGSVQSWIESGYIDEITDFSTNESLPFPNVTICAQLYFNQTFIRENLIIPNRMMANLRHQDVPLDEFYRQLALFLTPISRPRKFSATNLVLFSKVVAANPQLEDYSSFSTDAWLRCESMLQRCWFGGQEFDCCINVVTSFDEDGICFQLALNLDSDNAQEDTRTFRQRTPGPSGGLDVEVSIDTRDSPWLEDDAQNGFRILVGHTALAALDTPAVAPHGAHTFIKVTPEKRLLATECSGKNQLKLPFNNDIGYYYDPEGIMCALQHAQEMATTYTSCKLAIGLFRPNRTVVCPPLAAYAGSSLLAEDLQTHFASLATSGGNNTFLKDLMNKVEETLHNAMNNKAECRKHCQRWTYSSSASFFYLENEDNATTKDTGRMYSKLSIYYANLDYRQYEEVKETTLYLAFCDLGNIVGLYWGMSIASFFHVFYYVPRYFYVRRQCRRNEKVAIVDAPAETSLV